MKDRENNVNVIYVRGKFLCVKGSYIIIYNKFSNFLGTAISSPPAKKRVERPSKPYIFEQAQNTMAKYLDFYMMIDLYMRYDQQFKSYC